MSPSNFDRMIELATTFFDAKNDPDQISVTEQDIARLHSLHPASMTEATDAHGPIAWILVIPTTTALMDRFLAKEIGEQTLLDETPVGATYDALYLCSALVLPEHRGKGLARTLLNSAVASIRADHPIRTLFFWGFSVEGERLAASVARACGLPLRQRTDT